MKYPFKCDLQKKRQVSEGKNEFFFAFLDPQFVILTYNIMYYLAILCKYVNTSVCIHIFKEFSKLQNTI
jgi:hypothetical protein